MARPRIYDEDVVIKKATLVFWKKGFAETSSRDLIAAIGLDMPLILTIDSASKRFSVTFGELC